MGPSAETIFWVLFILYACACAGFCVQLADVKGRSQGWWILGGFCFGILALIAIAGMPDRNITALRGLGLVPARETRQGEEVECGSCHSINAIRPELPAQYCNNCGALLTRAL
jgi:hypothetical protein